MNATADHSHNTSSAIQVKSEPTHSTMDISAKKSQQYLKKPAVNPKQASQITLS